MCIFINEIRASPTPSLGLEKLVQIVLREGAGRVRGGGMSG